MDALTISVILLWLAVLVLHPRMFGVSVF